MLIVGEKINTIIPSINKVIKEKDKEALQELALEEITRGAQVLDVNADDLEKGNVKTSKENIKWAVATIQEITDLPLMIDSADPRVLAAGLEVYNLKKGTAFLNSLNEENKEKIAPLLLKYNSKVVVMADLNGRKSVEEKVETARKLRDYLRKKGIELERIYIDLAVTTVAVDPEGPLRVIKTVKRIHRDLGLKTICAPSNVSDGAPKRKFLNVVFIKMLEEAGIDAVICNPRHAGTDLSEQALEITHQVLEGKDRRFKQYRKLLEDDRGKK